MDRSRRGRGRVRGCVLLLTVAGCGTPAGDDPTTVAAVAGSGSQLQQLEAALTAARASGQSSSEAQALEQIARHLQRRGELERAATVLRELVAVRDLPRERLQLAWAELDRGRFDAARGEFERVRERWPNSVGARVGLGVLARRDGRLNESRCVLEEAVAADPGAEEARYQLAQTYRALGLPSEAEAALFEFEQFARQRVDARIEQAAEAAPSFTERNLESLGALTVGTGLAGDWTIAEMLLERRDRRVLVHLDRTGSPRVTLFVSGPAGNTRSGPFDVGSARIAYKSTELAFAEYEAAGREVGQRIAAAVTASDPGAAVDGWIAAALGEGPGP